MVRLFSALAICISALAHDSIAQVSASSDAVGFTAIEVAAASRQHVVLPLNDPPVYAAIASSVASSTVTTARAGWTTNAFGPFTSNPHIVRLVSGMSNGREFRIASNTDDTLTLITNGSDLNGILAPGDRYEIVPLQTLESLFGTTNPALICNSDPQLADNILVRAAYGWLTYYNDGTQWLRAGGGGDQENAAATLPATGFVFVRRGPAAYTIPLAGAVRPEGSSDVPASGSTTVDWSNSETTRLLDSQGNPLPAGAAAVNGDGTLVELGYFSSATAVNKFAGTWIPLTGHGGSTSTIGDSHRLTGLGGGRIGFNTFYRAGSDVVNVYDTAAGDTGASAGRATVVITSSTPPDGQILAIRFYDSTDRTNGHYNTVSSSSWQWRSPDLAGQTVTIDLAHSSLEFEDATNAFRTSIAAGPTPTVTPGATASPTPAPSSTVIPGTTPSPTAIATATATASPTASAIPTASPAPPMASRVANISTRLAVGMDDDVLIGGFIVTGTAPKQIIVRAIGPSLPLNGALLDPLLELHRADGALIAANDDWATDTSASQVEASGIAPDDAREAAFIRTVEPGAYTAIIRGKNAQTGIALVEVYEMDGNESQLANVSTRGFVQTNDDVMIGGLIVTGTGAADILVRAIGPSLPLVKRLADPVLELHAGNGELLTTNDDWRETQPTEIAATGIPPLFDSESAIRTQLRPGNYTAVVRGKNGSTGVALVEFYRLP